MGTMAERLGKPVSGADTRRRHASSRIPEEELRRFEEGWTKMMVTIWREKLQLLGVYDTGALFDSIQFKLLLDGIKKTIEFQFYQYGKYADDGTGREFTNAGYTDKNGRTYPFNRPDSMGRIYTSSRLTDGTLPFLDDQYRQEHGLDKPKKVGPAWGGRVAGGHPRRANEWFYRKYYASRMVLNELERDFYGNAYLGMMTTALDGLLGQVRVL